MPKEKNKSEENKENLTGETEKTEPKETINITREELKTLAKQIADDARKEFSDKIGVQQEELKKAQEQIQILTESADISRLNKAQMSRRGALVHTVKISTYEGKAVVAWSNVVDIVEKINNVWTEKQIMRITLEDGLEKEMPYPEFYQALLKNKIVCDILSRTTDSSGNEVLKLKRQDNGKIYDLDVCFVN